MNPNKLHYVETIAELRSFSRAAEKLYISQPALTKSINKLEAELGVKLFDRSVQPVQLTYAGERYIAGMRNINAMQTQLQNELEDISNMKKGRLIVGVPGTRGTRWLPYILPTFLRDYPGIDIRVVEGTTGSLENALMHESVDVVIASSLPQMVVGLDYEVLHQEPLMILASPKHPMFRGLDISAAVQNRQVLHYISPERLENQAYIASAADQGLYRSATQMFQRFSVHPKVITTISHTSTSNALAADGIGFVVTPTHSAFSAKLSKREIITCTISDPPVTRAIIITYKHGRPLSSAAQRFLEITRSAVQTEPALHPRILPVVHDIGD